MLSNEWKRPSAPSKPAERKTNRLKRKDLRNACVSRSQVLSVIQFQ
ncbi:conserved domain protein [Ruminococcus albus 8]|uniref:Conserved domain protein n=1 Tax=Ruminococcus albus 8 TaxID=246199 RepID=E9SAB5_RUMAL|nr:conserved domain protein [Ruminococcus albus 8]